MTNKTILFALPILIVLSAGISMNLTSGAVRRTNFLATKEVFQDVREKEKGGTPINISELQRKMEMRIALSQKVRDIKTVSNMMIWISGIALIPLIERCYNERRVPAQSSVTRS